MQTHTPHSHTESGFTLVELSIVLVIIGLIIGGILVGQDMIKAAEVRATVAQIEKYNSSVNTFREKFRGIPGDLNRTNASAFGLALDTVAATVGQGDGNGVIEGGAAGATDCLGEPCLFWRHLTDAQLIDGGFGAAIDLTTGAPAAATVTDIKLNLPPAKLGRGNYWTVYSVTGLNYYQIVPVATIPTSGAYTFNTNTGITPIEAFNIDTKVDDGLPNTGATIARATSAMNTAPTFNAAVTANVCLLGTGVAITDTYQRTTTGATQPGTQPSCSLRMRFN